jgi:hypothetical protein
MGPEDRASELQDRTTEITQLQQQREKSRRKDEGSLWDPGAITKRVLPERRKKAGLERYSQSND